MAVARSLLIHNVTLPVCDWRPVTNRTVPQDYQDLEMQRVSLILTLIITLTISASAQTDSQDENLYWTGMERALQLSESNGKLILIDVYAEWCPYCQRMQDEVYPDQAVIDMILEYFIPVRINIESQEPLRYLGRDFTEEEFSRALQYQSIPTTYFMNERGEVVGQQPGLLPAEMFTDLLEYVGSRAFEKQTFDEFKQSKDS